MSTTRTDPIPFPQASGLKPQASPIPGPIRMLRALNERLRNAFGLDVMPGLITDELDQLDARLGQARSIASATEAAAARLQALWQEVWADHVVTPGEARRLRRAQRQCEAAARHTTHAIRHCEE